jgi:hypothetical protein
LGHGFVERAAVRAVIIAEHLCMFEKLVKCNPLFKF